MNLEVAPGDLLKQLGIERVVWIDDNFDDSVEHLLEAFRRTPSLTNEIPSLKPASDLLDEFGEPFDEVEFEKALQKAMQDLSPQDSGKLNEVARNHAATEEGKGSEIVSPPEDLNTETANAVCTMLGIKDEDRIGFEDGLAFVNVSEGTGSANLAIIVDMQNAFQGVNLGDQAGLKVLDAIYGRDGEEMVFVLTHEAAVETESEKEAQIVDQLKGAQRFPCVISKSRLQKKSGEDLSVELNVALKRSALRREVYKVGKHAQQVVSEAVGMTRDIMCRIPPEELDHAFVQRAIKEGVSDLHMIERIISGQISKSVQKMFIDDREMHDRMRMLRGIGIGEPSVQRHDVIEQFRFDEIWDDGAFLAAGRAPLALGDVFETVADGTKRQFVLLGQPCDLALRSNGRRSAIAGDLLSFAEATDDEKKNTVYAGRKSIDLLVGAGGRFLRFNFRHASPAQLAILDLATFSPDGNVAIQSDQEDVSALLPGQAKALEAAKKLLAVVAKAQKVAKDNPEHLRKADAKCKLTLRYDSHFNSVCTPTFTTTDDVTKLDWNLRRIRRLRSPYIDLLMDQHVALLNRRAVDIEYLADSTVEPTPKAQKSSPEEKPLST